MKIIHKSIAITVKLGIGALLTLNTIVYAANVIPPTSLQCILYNKGEIQCDGFDKKIYAIENQIINFSTSKRQYFNLVKVTYRFAKTLAPNNQPVLMFYYDQQAIEQNKPYHWAVDLKAIDAYSFPNLADDSWQADEGGYICKTNCSFIKR
jgi:hypothetical protein